jgi:hypothetical protein
VRLLRCLPRRLPVVSQNHLLARQLRCLLPRHLLPVVLQLGLLVLQLGLLVVLLGLLLVLLGLLVPPLVQHPLH